MLREKVMKFDKKNLLKSSKSFCFDFHLFVGISTNSLYSVDSINSDGNELNTSTLSLNHPSPQPSTALSPSNSYDAPTYEVAPSTSLGLRHRRNTNEWAKENRKSSEIYTWWDDMMDDKQK